MKVLGLALVCVVLVGTVGLIGMNNSIPEVETYGSMDEMSIIHEDYTVNGWEMYVEYMNLSNIVVDEVI
jgi:hypothetical protein